VLFGQNPKYEIRALFSPVYYNLDTDLNSENKFSYIIGFGMVKSFNKLMAANIDLSLSQRNYSQYTSYDIPLNWYIKEYQDSYTYFDVSTKMSFTVISRNLKLAINPGFVWSFQINKERKTIDYDNNIKNGFYYKCDFTEHPIYLYLGISIKNYISSKIGIELEPFFRFKLNKQSVYSGICPFDDGRFSYGISLIVLYFKGK
jgi:hypothetical protein